MPRSAELSRQMRIESRARLLQSARRLFAQQGYYNTRVAEVAADAGMSQGNVYWYFQSKEVLLKAVLAEGFDRLTRIVAEIAALDASAAEKLDQLIDDYSDFGQEGIDFITIMLTLIGRGGTELLVDLGFEMEKIGAQLHRSLSLIFEQGKQEGLIDRDRDSTVLVMSFFAYFNGLILTYREDWTAIPRGTLRDIIYGMLGVGSIPHNK